MSSQTQAGLTPSDGAGTAAAFTFAVPAALSRDYRHLKGLITCVGGTCTAVFKQWVHSARKVDCSDAVSAIAQGSIGIDGGPYTNLEIAISANTGTVTADLECDHPYSGGTGQ